MERHEICLTCRYWESGEEAREKAEGGIALGSLSPSDCRRNAPAGASGWAKTKWDDWCGNWQPERMDYEDSKIWYSDNKDKVK